MRRKAVASLALLALTAAVFAPVAGNEFIFLDDPAYILENPHVRAGLTLQSAAWALTSFEVSNWHPLTWLSHMLDVELFGVAPAGHHLMSVALHGAAAVALFAVLEAATGAFWPALSAAAAFALHPLRVESVAWAAERKDVLAALFWMLCLAVHLRQARRPGLAPRVALAAAFALGLAAKPMLVTLPAVLLLLDYWPLGRARTLSDAPRLLAEKAPLAALSALSAALTLKAQAAGEALVPLAVIPFGQRLANAAVSAAAYLAQTVWPGTLSIHYPNVPGGPGASRVALAALALLALAAAALAASRRRPYLLVGGGWYLVALAPVAGLVQVGGQAMADRYTYLPCVGPVVAAVWLARELAGSSRARRGAFAAAGTALLLAWGVAAQRYVRVWRDGVSLFAHALRAAPANNWMGHFGLANELVRHGRVAEAIPEYERFLELQPADLQGRFNLALCYDLAGDAERAALHYRRTLQLKPDHADAHNNLGVLLAAAGDSAGAAEHFRAALRARPGFREAQENLDRATK